MEEKNYNRLPPIKDAVSKILRNHNLENGSITLYYQSSPGLPKFKITIEMDEPEFYIDSRGVKWVRAK